MIFDARAALEEIRGKQKSEISPLGAATLATIATQGGNVANVAEVATLGRENTKPYVAEVASVATSKLENGKHGRGGNAAPIPFTEKECHAMACKILEEMRAANTADAMRLVVRKYPQKLQAIRTVAPVRILHMENLIAITERLPIVVSDCEKSP